MAYQPYYSPYPQTTGGYYTPPMQDQLAQLRQPYQQPAPQAMQQPVPQPQAQPGIVWVPNETAAREYLVAPNSAVAMWDSSAPVVYLKQADASGKPTLKVYDLVERAANASVPQNVANVPLENYVTREEFDRLSARLDALAAKDAAKSKKVKEDVE